MPLDLFEELNKTVKSLTDPQASTEACGEEGNWCGGGPVVAIDPWPPVEP